MEPQPQTTEQDFHLKREVDSAPITASGSTTNTALAKFADDIRTAHAEVIAGQRTSLVAAIRAGAVLRKAKDYLTKHRGYGTWEKWTSEHVKHLGERTIKIYLQLANHADVLEAQSTAPSTIEDALQVIRAHRTKTGRAPHKKKSSPKGLFDNLKKYRDAVERLRDDCQYLLDEYARLGPRVLELPPAVAERMRELAKVAPTKK